MAAAKGVCDRIKHINIPDSAQAGQCGSDGCLDIALLNQLEQEIQAMPHDGIIVLHTMGSHGPAYYQRYTPEFRRFTPTCDSTKSKIAATPNPKTLITTPSYISTTSLPKPSPYYNGNPISTAPYGISPTMVNR